MLDQLFYVNKMEHRGKPRTVCANILGKINIYHRQKYILICKPEMGKENQFIIYDTVEMLRRCRFPTFLFAFLYTYGAAVWGRIILYATIKWCYINTIPDRCLRAVTDNEVIEVFCMSVAPIRTLRTVMVVKLDASNHIVKRLWIEWRLVKVTLYCSSFILPTTYEASNSTYVNTCTANNLYLVIPLGPYAETGQTNARIGHG